MSLQRLKYLLDHQGSISWNAAAKVGRFQEKVYNFIQRVSNETLHFNQHGSVLDLARDSCDKFILESVRNSKQKVGGQGVAKKPPGPRTSLVFLFKIRNLTRQRIKLSHSC